MLQEAKERQMDQQAQTVEPRNTLKQFAQYSAGTTTMTSPINFLSNTQQQTEHVSGIMGLSISLFTQLAVDLSQSPCFQ
jgi:radical SAM superfamily enzyme